EPREDDPAPFQILAEGIGLAIGGLKGVVRCLVPDLELGLGDGWTGEQSGRDERERKQPAHLPHLTSCYSHHDSTGTIRASSSIVLKHILTSAACMLT